MAQTIETTLVTEAYNLAEGMGYAELEAAVATVAGIASAQPTVEALLVDGSDDPRVTTLVARHPGLVHVPVPGADYDALKNAAAQAARGRYVAFLDGDCRPLSPDIRWVSTARWWPRARLRWLRLPRWCDSAPLPCRRPCRSVRAPWPPSSAWTRRS